ncbi:MAG: phytanoyl-CoA dioxygenase family protein [bacterium]
MGLAADIRELGLLVVDHKRYARQRTLKGRRFFNALFKAVHLRSYRRLQRLSREIGAVDQTFAIPEDEGFVLWRSPSFAPLREAIAEANAVFDAADLGALTRAMPEDAPFTHVPYEPKPGSAIARLATHPAMIKPFAEYLGIVPILHALQLMYSPNHRLVQGSSQYYHLDGQDVKSLQVFVYLQDVTEDNGPLTLLAARPSERIADTLRYRKAAASRRIDDGVIDRSAGGNRDVHVLTGRAGSVLIFDGDRCFHFGSRKATRPRRILHYAYVTPFAFTLPDRWPERFRHLVPRDAPEWQRRIVMAS